MWICRAGGVQRLIQKEMARKTRAMIKKALQQQQGASITNIDVCKNVQWVRKEAQPEVEVGIVAENTACFRLTEDTPLMAGENLSDLGYFGDTAVTIEVFRGEYTAHQKLTN